MAELSAAQHHLPPVPLAWGRNSRAYWSVKPSGKALIFVHGFNGRATSTWTRFPWLLPDQKTLSGYDIIFYGYDSLTVRAHNSALNLTEFLDSLIPAQATVHNSSLPAKYHRGALAPYEEVFIVAHSLGAVVARLALLDAHRLEKKWCPMTTMILYAPAHMGTNTIHLAGQALCSIPFIGRMLSSLVTWRNQVLQDLETDCQTLKSLVDETKRLRIDRGEDVLRAKTVILGEQDHIINPVDFPGDPVPIQIKGAGHNDVCRPKAITDPRFTALVDSL